MAGRRLTQLAVWQIKRCLWTEEHAATIVYHFRNRMSNMVGSRREFLAAPRGRLKLIIGIVELDQPYGKSFSEELFRVSEEPE